MRYIVELIRDYFGFSTSEMRGLWILLFLGFISLLWMPTLKKILQHSYQYEYQTGDQQFLDSLIAVLNQKKKSPSRDNDGKVTHSHFDPNYAALDEFKQNGLPEWLGRRIIKYREKGGRFIVKSDLLKIYGFSTTYFESVSAYIQLPDEKPANIYQSVRYDKPDTATFNVTANTVTKEIKIQDINLTDSVSLQAIPGIGKVFSARIIRFRDKLGGIHHTTQFSEVYHLSPEAVDNLKKYTYVSENFEVKKVNINTDDVSTLAQHPYISFPLAKALVRHRDDYGMYEDIIDCKEVHLMDETTFLKLAPYLSL